MNWDGPWVGTWLKDHATNACGQTFSTGGIMTLELLTAGDILTGAGGTSGHFCMNGECQLLNYDDCADAVVGTITNNNVFNAILTAHFIDGSCAGGDNEYSLVGTNMGTYITGTMQQLNSGAPGSWGPNFLVYYAPEQNTNKIVEIHRQTNGSVSLAFIGGVSNKYEFQISTNLKDWSTESTFTVTNSPWLVVDPHGTNKVGKFYRFEQL